MVKTSGASLLARPSQSVACSILWCVSVPTRSRQDRFPLRKSRPLPVKKNSSPRQSICLAIENTFPGETLPPSPPAKNLFAANSYHYSQSMLLFRPAQKLFPALPSNPFPTKCTPLNNPSHPVPHCCFLRQTTYPTSAPSRVLVTTLSLVCDQLLPVDAAPIDIRYDHPRHKKPPLVKNESKLKTIMPLIMRIVWLSLRHSIPPWGINITTQHNLSTRADSSLTATVLHGTFCARILLICQYPSRIGLDSAVNTPHDAFRKKKSSIKLLSKTKRIVYIAGRHQQAT